MIFQHYAWVALPRIPCQQRVKGFSARQLKGREEERKSKRERVRQQLAATQDLGTQEQFISPGLQSRAPFSLAPRPRASAACP